MWFPPYNRESEKGRDRERERKHRITARTLFQRIDVVVEQCFCFSCLFFSQSSEFIGATSSILRDKVPLWGCLVSEKEPRARNYICRSQWGHPTGKQHSDQFSLRFSGSIMETKKLNRSCSCFELSQTLYLSFYSLKGRQIQVVISGVPWHCVKWSDLGTINPISKRIIIINSYFYWPLQAVDCYYGKINKPRYLFCCLPKTIISQSHDSIFFFYRIDPEVDKKYILIIGDCSKSRFHGNKTLDSKYCQNSVDISV